MPPGPRNDPSAPELFRLELSKYVLWFPCGETNVLPTAKTAWTKLGNTRNRQQSRVNILKKNLKNLAEMLHAWPLIQNNPQPDLNLWAAFQCEHMQQEYNQII